MVDQPDKDKDLKKVEQAAASKQEAEAPVKRLEDLSDEEREQAIDNAENAIYDGFAREPAEARAKAVEHLLGDTAQADEIIARYQKRFAETKGAFEQKIIDHGPKLPEDTGPAELTEADLAPLTDEPVAAPSVDGVSAPKVGRLEQTVFGQPEDDTGTPSLADLPEAEPVQPSPAVQRPEPAVTFPTQRIDNEDGTFSEVPVDITDRQEPAVRVGGLTEEDQGMIDRAPTGPRINEEALRETAIRQKDLDEHSATGPEINEAALRTLDLGNEPGLDVGPDLNVEMAKLARNQAEFSALTDTSLEKHPTSVEEAEKMQAALLYELNQLAGYVPALREERARAIPNIEFARKRLNEGVQVKEGDGTTTTYPDVFSPEAMAKAMADNASTQAWEASTFFGGSYEDWRGRQGVKETAAKAAKEQFAPKESIWKGTPVLSQAWRLGKLAVNTGVRGTVSTGKAIGILGSRFAANTIEKVRRNAAETKDPQVVAVDKALSRGQDVQNKLDRINAIQAKLHALRLDRERLQKAPTGTLENLQTAEQPQDDAAAVEQMVQQQMWQEVCDKGLGENKDAAIARLVKDPRSINDLFLTDTSTGERHLNDPELQASFNKAQLDQMRERAKAVIGNRPAIREVCRMYVGRELQTRGDGGRNQAGLEALQAGKFLFTLQGDGSMDVELLLSPAKRAKNDFDEDTSDSGSSDYYPSMHIKVPAETAQTMLAEISAGNVAETRRLNDQALARIFEGNIEEPKRDSELGQDIKTETAIDSINTLLDKAKRATAVLSSAPTEANATILRDIYKQINSQLEEDKLGKVTLDDQTDQQQFDQFVLGVAKAEESINAFLTTIAAADKAIAAASETASEAEAKALDAHFKAFYATGEDKATLVAAAKEAKDVADKASADKVTALSEKTAIVDKLSESLLTRSKEFSTWHLSLLNQEINHLNSAYVTMVDAAPTKPCRFAENTVLTLPGRLLGGKEATEWRVVNAKNGVYALESTSPLVGGNSHRMVMTETDLANWLTIANKEQKAKAKTDQPTGFVMPKAA